MRYLVLLLALFFASPAVADEGKLANPTFQSIITHQLQAFASDDGASAYGDAAPLVQKLFPNSDIFMSMVRGGYAPVYRQKSYDFGGSGTDANGRPYQRVGLLGVDGVRYEAVYFMEQQADGSWKIAAVQILEVAGVDV